MLRDGHGQTAKTKEKLILYPSQFKPSSSRLGIVWDGCGIEALKY